MLTLLRRAVLFESSRSHPQQLLTVFRAERSLLVDIPTGWEPRTEQQPTGLIAHPTLWVGPYELHLLIFPQPLGRSLKNQNAAPTTPPCFCRRQRSSSLQERGCSPLSDPKEVGSTRKYGRFTPVRREDLLTVFSASTDWNAPQSLRASSPVRSVAVKGI